MIEFLCSNIECGYSRAVSGKHLGKRATCPKCKTVTRITDDESVVDLAVVAEAGPDFGASSAQPTFDESRTFAYKGDFLGMTIDQFISRHQSDNPSEFSMLWSDSMTPEEYEAYGVSEWIRKEDKVRKCVALGSRLTIVGVSLENGHYIFFNKKLFAIHLYTKQESLEVDIDIRQGLTEALGAADENKSPYEYLDIEYSTWKRPDGHLTTAAYYAEGGRICISYVDQLTREEFASVVELYEEKSEASKDL